MSPHTQGRVALATGAASGIGRVTARRLAREGARVIVVSPGPTERTRLIENLTGTRPEERERTLKVIPMRRMAQPEEVAEAVVWPCSDASSFVTGHVMCVDGGMTSA